MLRTVKHLSCWFLWIGCLGGHFLDAQPAFFRKDISVGDGPAFVIVGDFNGDGRPDLAFRSWACRLPSSLTGPYQRCPTGTVGGVITVLLNAGGGNFAPPSTRSSTSKFRLTRYSSLAADVNADGKLDLLGYSLGSTPGIRTAFFLPGRGNGTFLQPREIQPGYPVATGDFNGDRIPDLLLGRDLFVLPVPNLDSRPRHCRPRHRWKSCWATAAGFFQTSARIDFSALDSRGGLQPGRSQRRGHGAGPIGNANHSRDPPRTG